MRSRGEADGSIEECMGIREFRRRVVSIDRLGIAESQQDGESWGIMGEITIRQSTDCTQKSIRLAIE